VIRLISARAGKFCSHDFRSWAGSHSSTHRRRSTAASTYAYRSINTRTRHVRYSRERRAAAVLPSQRRISWHSRSAMRKPSPPNDFRKVTSACGPTCY
jgi:hypothetical protein